MDANTTPIIVNLDPFIEEVAELAECRWNDARAAVAETFEAWAEINPGITPDIDNEEHYDAIVLGADALI